jgi:hypothetical protein
MSTVLSLVVVPAFYLIMDDLSRLLAWVFGRMIGKKDEEAVPPTAEELVARLHKGDDRAALLNARLSALEERLGGRKIRAAE